jgi:hypothetical protein
MNNERRSRLDLLLDLLADEVAERLQLRSEGQRAETEPRAQDVPPIVAASSVPEANLAPASELASMPAPEPTTEFVPDLTIAPAPEASLAPAAGPTTKFVPEIAPASHAAALMVRLALGVFIIIVLINIPLNAQGTALARSIPSTASLIIRNGLVVKESTSPDIWVYREGAFHRIADLEAFEQLGYRWQDVHIVNPGFLTPFAKGSPRYVLLKCASSPHFYRIEAGRKRWIVDIPTFEAEGYIWQDLKVVPCADLRDLPDGESIPPGHGAPPPPLP